MKARGLAVLQMGTRTSAEKEKKARKLTDPISSTTRNGNLEALVGIRVERVAVGRPPDEMRR